MTRWTPSRGAGTTSAGRRRRRPVGILSATVGAVAIAGCASSSTGPVHVPAPHVSASAARRCSALIAALPARVGDQPRRATQPRSSLTAAWGPHPITLRCGVPLPAELTPGNPSFDPTADAEWINGLNWLIQQGSHGAYSFTTLDRATRVDVTVPAGFNPRRSGEPQTDPLVDVTGAILRTIPDTAGHFTQDTAP